MRRDKLWHLIIRWGKRIGTIAVKEACNYIFRNTDILRISAVPFANNTASCHILEKAGFVLKGTLRKNAFKNGKILDMKMYALVKD
jgi:RimJ/RimL family protein N-acetyltransferase